MVRRYACRSSRSPTAMDNQWSCIHGRSTSQSRVSSARVTAVSTANSMPPLQPCRRNWVASDDQGCNEPVTRSRKALPDRQVRVRRALSSPRNTIALQYVCHTPGGHRVQKRILIIEDEESIRDMVAFALRKADMQSVHAADASAALLAIAESIPDLILLDWMLPGTSGMELARRLRKDDIAREIPIIMLTARGEETDRVAGLEAGVDDY